MEKNPQLLDEAKKRFQQIMEYTTIRHKYLDEAGNEEQPMDGAQDAAPDDMGAADQSMGGGDMAGDQGMDPTQQGAEPPMDANGGMPGAEQPMDANGGDQSASPEGFNPQVPQDGMGDMGMDAMPSDNGVQPDDEVVDVSDLTDSQEETQEDVDKLGDKFDKVMKYLGQFEELIKANDEKINDLKAEFERRNPTQVEKLSMQTAKSYPFDVTPEEFWKQKEATTNYRTEDDDNGKEQGQYVITKNDVDGTVDWKAISDTLDDFDVMHQTMKNTMGFGF